MTPVLSLAFAAVAAVSALCCAGLYYVLPFFGEVTLWQVLAYVGQPATALPPDQRRMVWLCYGIAVLVFASVAAANALLAHLFRCRFGRRGVWCVHCTFLIFIAEGCWATFEYLDDRLGVRYEIRSLQRPLPLYKDEFKWVDPASVPFRSGKRNLLVLVGESLEESYIDGKAYGANLMPRLESWRDRHDRFGTMETVYGTDHTICSLFGMVYGSPRLQINGLDRSVSFADYPEVVLPNAWKVWLDNGFACRFVKGGEISFACTDKVFRAVPGVTVHDKSRFEDDPDYRKEPHPCYFGVNDAVVIGKRLRGETEELVQEGKPFVMFVWTLDTHCSGWVSGLQKPRHSNRLAHAIMQTDDLLSDYLAWFERQPFAAETAVVVIGDHVGHTSFPSVAKHERHPYNALSLRGLQNIPQHQSFAAFDLAPTFLELTGAQLPDGRFGLGTSLLRQQPTLLERIGRKRYEDEIRACGADYRRIAFGW